MAASGRPRPGFIRPAALAALLVLPACFVYVPVDPATARPGEDVRLVVSYDASRASSTFAARHGQTLEGGLLSMSEDSVALSVWIGNQFRGTPFESVRETFAVPRRDVLRIERRELSRWRTGLSGLALAAGIAVLLDRFAFTEDPNPSGGPEGPPAPPPSSRRE